VAAPVHQHHVAQVVRRERPYFHLRQILKSKTSALLSCANW
jgi:hypothetical protein